MDVSKEDTVQIGIVVLNYSDEGLAALQWASDFGKCLSAGSKFYILIVRDDESNVHENETLESETAKDEAVGNAPGQTQVNETPESETVQPKDEAIGNVLVAPGQTQGQPDLSWEVLCAVAEKHRDNKFVEYIEKFNFEEVEGRQYKTANIQETLEQAIEEFKLDTLVIGMEAAGSTGALKLKSACSVVLAKKDPKPVEVLATISAADAKSKP